MTRLEAGAVVPNTSLHDLGDIVGSVLRRAGKILARHRVEVALEPDLPMVRVDAVLLEQALFNLLDNAAKYAPPETEIRIEGWRETDSVFIQVLDEGEGISAENIERIFEKFFRAKKEDQVRPGTGLGLGISRGFIEAMKGTLSAGNRTDRSGAVFTIRLPLESEGGPADSAA
jgi:two-component system sensor histidine kinase KdpD